MERIVTELQALGLSAYEAKAYHALALNHPVTGYELAKKSGVSISKIYETLGRLQAQGLVCCISENPALYIPLPPEQFLERLQREFNERTALLGAHFQKMTAKVHSQFVWSINDGKEMLAKALAMIERAGTKLYISCWDREFGWLAAGLEQAAGRGVQIFLLSHGEMSFERGVCVRHGNDESVLAERGRELFIVRDDLEVIVGQALGEHPAAVWTENSSMVMVVREFILHEIALWRLINACSQSSQALSIDTVLGILRGGQVPK